MINLTINNFADANDLFDYIALDEAVYGHSFTTGQIEVIYDFYKQNYPDRIISSDDIYRDWTGYDSMEDACDDLGYEMGVDLMDDYTVLYVADTGEVVVAV